MLRTVRKRNDVSVSDVILGRNVAYGDWSSHVRAWDPRNRAGTLLLRYEDLNSDPSVTLAQVAAFIHLPQTLEWNNRFGELHDMMPEFFARRSDDANVAQMTEEELQLFWENHRDCMREYAYGG